MKLKRQLYLWHRWMGVGMCLLLAMWFFSGVVMMYVGFPSLTDQERLTSLPPLQADNVHYPPERLMQHLGTEERIASLRLTTIAGEPVYRLETSQKSYYVLSANTGALLSPDSPSTALASAQAYLENVLPDSETADSSIHSIEMDQWTVSSSLHSHRPLYKIEFEDHASTHLYVSSRTGEVVRDTVATERWLNWLGANLHWIYPLALRRHADLWYWLIVILSLIGLTSIVTGSIIGFQRMRIRKRYRGKDITPYRGTMKWHHLLGLGCMVFLFTYMFSGLMSMSPFGIFNDQADFTGLTEHYKRATLPSDPVQFQALRQKLANSEDIKEVRWSWVNGQVSLIAVSRPYDYQKLDRPDSLNTAEQVSATNDQTRHTLSLLMQEYAPGASVTDLEVLGHYDLYYYSHHDRHRPLPVQRIQFNDVDNSWFYLDIESGELVMHQTRKDRLQRWLYNGLHSLDFNFLTQNRPLWDIVVIVLSVLGFLLSITSIVIGWKRLANS